jgi:hypothetical protein
LIVGIACIFENYIFPNIDRGLPSGSSVHQSKWREWRCW